MAHVSEKQVVEHKKQDAGQGTLATYSLGFIFSIALTLTAYTLVEVHVRYAHEVLSHRFLIPMILALAVVQLFVQLVFFLHLDRESKPRWNLMIAGLAALVVLIVVIGSLWIMSNLNYRMMSSPAEIDKYLQSQGNL